MGITRDVSLAVAGVVLAVTGLTILYSMARARTAGRRAEADRAGAKDAFLRLLRGGGR